MNETTEHDEHKQELKNIIFVEPVTIKIRPYLVEYLLLLVIEAKKLSQEELFSNEGNEIATSICGALAWQDAEGVENDGWFNKKDEPILSRLLDIAGSLDADAHRPGEWRRLFEIAKQLQLAGHDYLNTQ